jgi:AmmeMemoRadiSam system protein A
MLTGKEKKILINIAKESIKAKLENMDLPDFYYGQEALNRKVGAFVTLKNNNQLRGCIGMLTANEALYKTISKMAIQAAFGDPRFPSLRPEEYSSLEYEISVLSPFIKIKSIDEIELGKHGLMINKDFYSGLLLPQVAAEYNWDRNEFLQHTCIKAGLNKDAWREEDVDIFIFSAEVFNSSEVNV